MEYYVLKKSSKGGFAVLTYLENVENSYDVKKGISLIDTWPESASFKMNPDYPKNVKIPDCFSNLDNMFVISERYRALISESITEGIEFLPVTVYNHKGKALKEPYYILNPLTVIDCINQEQSDITWNSIDPDYISSCLKLVLKEEVLENTSLIIRAKYKPNLMLIRKDLAKKIKKAKITGFRVVDVDEY